MNSSGYGYEFLAPMAEVTGSNPVGCANLFNWLCGRFYGQWSGLFPDNSCLVIPYVQVVESHGPRSWTIGNRQ
jgi:hypothetical protein